MRLTIYLPLLLNQFTSIWKSIYFFQLISLSILNYFFIVWWFHLLKKMSAPKHFKNKSGIVFFIEFLLIFTSYIVCSFNIIVSIHFLCFCAHLHMHVCISFISTQPSIHLSIPRPFYLSWSALGIHFQIEDLCLPSVLDNSWESFFKHQLTASIFFF